MLQTQSVYPATLALLEKVMEIPSLSQANLAGGTALALYYGHRISVDLDLFSIETLDLSTAQLDIEQLAISQNLEWEWNLIEETTLSGSVGGVKIDVIRYRYSLIDEITVADGIRLISIKDIAAMKLSACAQRGSKKDFYDIYELLQHFELAQLLVFFTQKYPKTDTAHIVRSLLYFDDAEIEAEPISLRDCTWPGVKRAMEVAVTKYLKEQV